MISDDEEKRKQEIIRQFKELLKEDPEVRSVLYALMMEYSPSRKEFQEEMNRRDKKFDAMIAQMNAAREE